MKRGLINPFKENSENLKVARDLLMLGACLMLLGLLQSIPSPAQSTTKEPTSATLQDLKDWLTASAEAESSTLQSTITLTESEAIIVLDLVESASQPKN